MARRLGRHRGTIGREIAAGGGRVRYRAYQAQNRAELAARRPKPGWTQTRPWLWAQVQALLVTGKWSPEQIAQRLRRDHPHQPQWWVSHEAIYQAIYIQTRGELRKQLAAVCAQAGPDDRTGSRPLGGSQDRGHGQHLPTASRGHRPGRARPLGRRPAHRRPRRQRSGHPGRTHNPHGHAHQTPRQDRPTRRRPVGEHITRLPLELARSLTWDQGPELAAHARFTVTTGIPVYFCDPHSPWQKGSNENWNGLVRQFLPKGTDLSAHSQTDLDHIAQLLNSRPRKTLGWDTPGERFNQLVAATT